ncbi:MAG: Holliday junction branch migration protein RuvA [Acidimicrobiia bacterium]|nr:Holliday junction branch migration protein RuvA [Acidimicrobiia bacterium]MDH5238347.1 Holliday junction branch migration protein RuvA [Acidimicrobiia bacterium]
MIGSLRGRLIDRDPTGEVLVECAGVGYRVTVTAATSIALGDLGDEAFLYVHHHIRETEQALYGFPSRDERGAFEILLSTHGIGPKLALDILDAHPPVELRRVLANDDVDALCLVPGVGKKTAQRLLVELKSKLDLPDVDLRSLDTVASAGNGGSVLHDVREALIGLGYSPDEIRAVVADLPGDGDPAELISDALRRLAVPR